MLLKVLRGALQEMPEKMIQVVCLAPTKVEVDRDP